MCSAMSEVGMKRILMNYRVMILPLLKLKEKGKAGLEKVFDEKLKGTDGTDLESQS